MNHYKLILWIFVFLNIIAFTLTGLDKYKSKHNSWRIRERTFFIIAALGGSAGVLAGMYFFRHKTKHKNFIFGIPLILTLQILLIYYIRMY